uniref:COG2308 Uncharacterized conserved protein n=1 Tax=uncultured bacterium B3TF_MPn1 TaxID=1439866 RepID=W0NTN8_9BACT|nr:COG2308 Uncharacterized conserved protein [uncultured bacterium B3TF_MPn1]
MAKLKLTPDWQHYELGTADELIAAAGKPHKGFEKVVEFFGTLSNEDLDQYRMASDLAIKEMGITFTVYNEEEGSIDRVWPFDIIPRIIAQSEWSRIEKGLIQRVKALNMFINDLYSDQKIIKDKVFPKELLAKSKNFRNECIGIKPAHETWAHICGSDLVRDADGTMYVLEDNLRVPSGVSYMLENRSIMQRTFPELFDESTIFPVNDYCSNLFDMLASLSPREVEEPEVVVLTPGIYNSAYFEHSYLAQQMGCELVEGRDLVVMEDDCVYMRTMEGLKRVDVIYRRIDDLFLDPEAFLPDSMLGVPGILRAWKKSNVALANAPGAGVADDKVVYAFVPDMIRYYLGEETLLPNVPTYLCMREKDREYVLKNLDKLVVKPANESGGYGMMIGPAASKRELALFSDLIKRDPRNYIAQPTLNISTAPTLVKNGVEPRHVDLRPFILSGKDHTVTMGGLTRVALRKGSLVVNSSQGGGSKDTWILQD